MTRPIVGSGMFWVLMILILLGLAGVVVSHAEEKYVPLTQAQALIWMDMVGPERVAQDVIRLDLIEHSVPLVMVPAQTFVLVGRDLVWGWEPSVLTLVVPGVTKSDPALIHYEVELKGGEQRGFVPVDRSWIAWSVAVGVGTLIGLVAGLLLR